MYEIVKKNDKKKLKKKQKKNKQSIKYFSSCRRFFVSKGFLQADSHHSSSCVRLSI